MLHCGRPSYRSSEKKVLEGEKETIPQKHVSEKSGILEGGGEIPRFTITVVRTDKNSTEEDNGTKWHRVKSISQVIGGGSPPNIVSLCFVYSTKICCFLSN